MISSIIVVDISTVIMIMIIATYGATLDGTAYPAPLVGPWAPSVAISFEQLEALSKQPGWAALRPEPPPT